MERYQICLDLELHFVPPMMRHGSGVTLTRVIELPFAPFNGLGLFSKNLDECPEPMGMPLSDVVWDLDRQLFLAKTEIEMQLPIADIVVEIRCWVERGWRLGSFLEHYEEDEDNRREPRLSITGDDCVFDDEHSEMADWPKRKPQKRPAAFNVVFKAVVRKMVELHNHLPAAYAMSKTQQFFVEDKWKTTREKDERRFRDLYYEFESMPFDKQLRWMTKIKTTYPRLEQLVR